VGGQVQAGHQVCRTPQLRVRREAEESETGGLGSRGLGSRGLGSRTAVWRPLHSPSNLT
jgi:hypothetical protein